MSELTKAFCNKCAGETNQEIVYRHSDKFRDKALEEQLREDGEPDAEAWYTTLTEVLKCRGCDGVTVCQKTCMVGEERSEDELRRDFGDEWTDILEIIYYPPVSARRKPTWMLRDSALHRFIPPSVKELMEEIYTALQNGSRRLVVMGTRAVLETIMVSKTGDQGNFKKNMDAFQAANYVSLRQRNTIETILEAGHATIHREWKPTDDEVSAVMDITENVIETTYLHEPRAIDIDPKVRRRLPRAGSGRSARPMGPGSGPDGPDGS
jgi:Domain of unknown function (DUF4145)